MFNRVSQDQLDHLLNYLMSHPKLAKGVGLGARSKETVDRQWDSLASTLNALGSGSSKTGDRWKKYWGDIKHKAKTRAAARKRDHTDTGGGPPSQMGALSDTDQKVLAIIGAQAVFGEVQQRDPIFVDSPVFRRRIRNVKSCGNQIKADSAWVIELERKRVEAEAKLANAFEIMAEASRVQAEASRVQAEAARSQVEVNRMLAESLAEWINLKNK